YGYSGDPVRRVDACASQGVPALGEPVGYVGRLGPVLTLELLDLQGLDFDLSLTGFDTKEIDDFLLKVIPDEDATPPLPEVPITQPGDLWLCGSHRVLCGDATDAKAVSRLLGQSQPFLMVTDPPYGIELDSEWRDRPGMNGSGWPESLLRSSLVCRSVSDTALRLSVNLSRRRALMKRLVVRAGWRARTAPGAPTC